MGYTFRRQCWASLARIIAPNTGRYGSNGGKQLVRTGRTSEYRAYLAQNPRNAVQAYPVMGVRGTS